jgi:hypothetical protein
MQVRSNSSPAEYTKEISIMGDPVRYQREMILFLSDFHDRELAQVNLNLTAHST